MLLSPSKRHLSYFVPSCLLGTVKSNFFAVNCIDITEAEAEVSGMPVTARWIDGRHRSASLGASSDHNKATNDNVIIGLIIEGFTNGRRT